VQLVGTGVAMAFGKHFGDLKMFPIELLQGICVSQLSVVVTKYLR
jgi:hypothetical protein